MIDLEAKLVDPETHEPMRRASQSQLELLRERIHARKARRHDGGMIDAIDGAFLSRGRRVAYPILGGIPCLLIELRIELDEPIPE
jgi:uncharacterized protein YbaR (Trm112 family)